MPPTTLSTGFFIRFITSPSRRLTALLAVLAMAWLGRAATAQPLPADTARPRISQIRIEGLRRTKPFILLRELSLRQGDTLPADTAAVFEREANRVFNTRLFIYARIRTIPDGKNRLLLLEVKERWYTFPGIILELADRSFNEWWYNRGRDPSRINYGIRFMQQNVRGRNETLRLLAQGGFTRKGELVYQIPYIDRARQTGLRFSALFAENASIAYRSTDNRQDFIKTEERTLYRRLSFGLGLSRRVGYYQFHSLEAAWSLNRTLDTVARANPDFLGGGRTRQAFWQLKYEWLLDRRDIRAYPLHGYMVDVNLEQIGLFKSDDVRISSFRTILGWYAEVRPKWYLALRTDLELSTPARQPYNLTRSLGYNVRILRGYDRNVIEGHLPFIGKAVLKRRLFSYVAHVPDFPIRQFNTLPISIYAKLFADAAYVRNPHPYPENRPLTNRWLTGFGPGLDIVTYYDSVIRLEYSFNDRLQHGFYLYFTLDI